MLPTQPHVLTLVAVLHSLLSLSRHRGSVVDGKKELVVDLHGLTVQASRAAAAYGLERAEGLGKDLVLITGKGKGGREPKVAKEVLSFLFEGGRAPEIDPQNSGRVRVRMNHNRAKRH